MRRFKLLEIAFVGCLSITFVLSCNNIKSDNPDKNPNNFTTGKDVPEIKFDTTFFDFGNVIEGEKVSCIFTFKNSGTGDLIIHDAYSTCGCTVPNFSKEPVKPGENGKIEVSFDSAGRNGVQYKNITLKLNTIIKEKTLTIKANVKPNKSIN
ncbi:MAG: hypothetical protein A2X13_00570 [Bacteroidetes bacterium GWC2_33_15]|nr:MAG: hypothetical protein A2X10_04380 [Bacteroidetes bacterium GWA2_33_15]OFX51113.1 MAG: hypothetical protein A2X13_00570 [Bacteroidetes bacterium GWC2_33_15]OFX66453.1 MAG: hypothetical protein A2X15_07385 [Bacteroidetes bacterium GWB2_32_14]OFX70321.1 MAG: hypothetical protein A2X14_03460 [Bacteroidetes bacterium GWD2_33_33]